MKNKTFLQLFASFLCICLLLHVSDGIAQSSISLKLKNGVQFEFKKVDDFLIGLTAVNYQGTPLKSTDHASLPLLCNEWHEGKWIAPFYRFKKLHKTEKGGMLELEVMASRSPELWKHFFALMPDYGKVSEQSMKQLHEAEQAVEEELINTFPDYKTAIFKLDSLQKVPHSSNFRQQEKTNNGIKRWTRRKDKMKNKYFNQLPPSLIQALALAQKQVDKEAAESSLVLRDAHRFAMPEVTAQSIKLSSLEKLLANQQHTLESIGTLRWYFEEEDAPSWQKSKSAAWTQHIEFQIYKDYSTNAIRLLNTWEVDGSTKDLTLINLKYRGLGNIEQKLGQGTSYCTSDIWPAPFAKTRNKVWKKDYHGSATREKDINQRLDANILLMARGAGTSFFDMQVKDNLAFIAHPERQDNWRAITESYPSDSCVSHIDEYRFASTNAFSTPVIKYVVYQTKDDFQPHQYRTLWAFTDARLRKQISSELGFVNTSAMPCVGMNWDIFTTKKSNTNCALNLAKIAPQLEEQGVKMAISHTSGWINGAGVKHGLDGQDTTNYLGSGSCNVYDWHPMPQLKSAWGIMYDSLNKHGIGYIPWITAMSKAKGAFAQEISNDPNHWALNSPDGKPNDIYETDMVKYNALNAEMVSLLDQRIMDNKKQYGFEGLWYDSFHNLWMSFLDWGNGKGAPMQRAWWEQLSKWTQRGVVLVSENQAFPGLNCSIESQGWETQPYYMGHTLKWLRNGEHHHYTASQLDTLGFKLLACGGWLTFDILKYSTDGPYQLPNEIMPKFSTYAQYWEQLQQLQAPTLYFLANDEGTVWWDEKNKEGLLFLWKKSATLSEYETFTAQKIGKAVYKEALP